MEQAGNDGGPRLKKRLEDNLKSLEAKKPVRERWPFCDKETDAPGK